MSELSTSDARIKRLMEQVGYPNSMSIYQAFKQLEMEVRLEERGGALPPHKADTAS